MVSAVNCGITGILDPATARFPGSLLHARLEARERMAHGAADERVSVQPHTQSRPSRLALSLIVLSAAAAPGSWLMSIQRGRRLVHPVHACTIQQPWVGI